ncbi:uncharacterized protein [Phaseolus vulgaris]|uniref:uncharacterized protein n=1 Tax=Phaseolus vulgaris TaxID=3885 RepID=UPI0035CA64D0
MKASQSRQKSYADQRRKPLEFAVGDHVFMRVTPTKGVGRAIRSRKLSPKFIGPYQILRKIGPVAYEIALPPQLANLHNVFHVSQLRKYIPDPSHVLEVDNVQIKDNLSFEAKPVRIEDHQSKQLRGKTINMVKVVWDDKSGDSTWELEETIRETYPYLFSNCVFDELADRQLACTVYSAVRCSKLALALYIFMQTGSASGTHAR